MGASSVEACKAQGSRGFKLRGLGGLGSLGVQEVRAWGLGFGVWSSGLAFGFGVQVLGFGFGGLGFVVESRLCLGVSLVLCLELVNFCFCRAHRIAHRVLL